MPVADELQMANDCDEDSALDLVYSRLYALAEKDIPAIDSLLKDIEVMRVHTTVLLAILTFTALPRIAKELNVRAFIGRVRQCLIAREGETVAKELLFGLDG